LELEFSGEGWRVNFSLSKREFPVALASNMTTTSRSRKFTYRYINQRESVRALGWFVGMDFCKGCPRLMTSRNTVV